MPDAPTVGRAGRRPKLRHRIEFAGHRLMVGVLSLAPEGLALGVGGVMGWMAGVLFRIRWRRVMEHLQEAFPEEDEKWRRRLARASYTHVGRQSVATFLMGRMDITEVRDRTLVEGYEAMREAWGQGKGLIVLSGHFGNWEVGGASIAAHGIPVEVVARRQRNPLFDRDLMANRNRLGMKVIDQKDAPRKVLKALREGRAVGIVGDQNVRRGGVFAEFFGRPASTARGTALFSLRTGAPLFLGVAKSLPGSPQRYQVTFEPVEFTPTGDTEEDVARLTEAHTMLLERKVREEPEQYFWQHRRWKTRPTKGHSGLN